MSNTFPGPVPPETNPPINPQYYQPKVYFISAITLGATTTVTTSVDHDYVIGQNVRLLIPSTYGSTQLNERQGYVISIPTSTQVVIDLNSSGGDAFIPNPTYGPTLPQIIAIGDINSGAINASARVNTGTFIPGSFINISPA